MRSSEEMTGHSLSCMRLRPDSIRCGLPHIQYMSTNSDSVKQLNQAYTCMSILACMHILNYVTISQESDISVKACYIH